VRLISRRALLRNSLFATPIVMGLPVGASDEREEAALEHGLARLERQHGGRLGVAILDTENGRLISSRGNERFPMCSTHKLITAALVLRRVDRGQETLSQRVIYSASDLMEYSPFTSKHTGKPGVTVGELCEAAVTLSDGTASNLILRSVGGPAAWTAWVRSLGDSATRLDRYEPEMDRVGPGDSRDTTTPIAMLRNVQKLVLGSVLSSTSRTQFTAWLLACKTGGNRLRAGLPPDWREADKTGTGPAINNAVNDVAVLWPPHRAPILVAAYYADSHESDAQRDAVLASIGRLVVSSV
jgi:beta-lactamase class A